MDGALYNSNELPRTAKQGQHNYQSIQSWKTKKNAAPITNLEKTPAQKEILASLEKAADGHVDAFDANINKTLAYAGVETPGQNETAENKETYKFEDIIDIINPLQHIPIVSTLYREMTNDKLHPMSQIMGGALFGGPIGAVTGTINAITQMQTGKDIGDHALHYAGLKTNFLNKDIKGEDPEQELNKIAQKLKTNHDLQELPGTALSFVNLGESGNAYKKIKIAEGRTAGSMFVQNKINGYNQQINFVAENKTSIPKIEIEKLPPRDKITSLHLSTMPPPHDT